jgi:caa(3)-type oxidase subunit IV
MKRPFLLGVLTWIALLILQGVEVIITIFSGLEGSNRLLILIPAAGMILLVVIVFMHVGRGPTIVRGFAAAAAFWLTILIGLGSIDAVTRVMYPVSQGNPR